MINVQTQKKHSRKTHNTITNGTKYMREK